LKLGLIVIIWLHYQQLYTNVNRNILLLYIFFESISVIFGPGYQHFNSFTH